MLDGAELGTALAARPDDTEAALAEYEQAMFVRAETPIDDVVLFESLFGDDAPPQALLDMVTAERADSASGRRR